MHESVLLDAVGGASLIGNASDRGELKMHQYLGRNFRPERPATLAEKICIIQEPIDQSLIAFHMHHEAARYPGNWLYYVLCRFGIGREEQYAALAKQLLSFGLICYLTILVFCAALFIFGGGYGIAVLIDPALAATVPTTICTVLASLILVLCVPVGLLVSGRLIVVEPARWERVSLNGFTGPVPGEVRTIARRVKSLFPELRLEVDVLMQAGHVLDPVLWVVDPKSGEQEPLFVWGEDVPEMAWRHHGERD